ncbi:hypothetical protein D3C71_1687630 [compost metagenome]
MAAVICEPQNHPVIRRHGGSVIIDRDIDVGLSRHRHELAVRYNRLAVQLQRNVFILRDHNPLVVGR